MRKFSTYVFITALCLIGSQLTAQIATYNLTASGAPTTIDANASATDFTATGVGSLGFGAFGATTNGWSLAGIDTGKYFQISVSPNATYDMNITDLNFSERRSSTGIRDYQVRWSKSATFATYTTIATVNVPDNDLVRIGDISGLNIDVLDGETIYFRFYGYNAEASGGTWRIQANSLEVLGTLTTPAVTNVSFDLSGAVVDEGDGTFDIDVNIANPDPTFATMVDVVLISGDGARVNGFTSTTLTFPANSSASQTATITITDNGSCTGNGDLVFQLQNASGGNNAAIATPSELDMTIIENDQTSLDVFVDNFESGVLNGWTENATGDWAASTTTPINGTYSLRHNLTGIAGDSHAAISLNDLNLDNYETTWRFQLADDGFDPSTNNKFWVYLASSSDNLATSSGANGYVVGVNLTGSSDLLTLSRVANGNNDATLITSALDWDANTVVGVEVIRTVDGEWTLRIDSDGGFDALSTVGSMTDNTYNSAAYFGLNFVFSSTRAGLLLLDDVSITNTGCFQTYYSQSSGNMSSNIWDIVTSGAGGSAIFNRHNSFVIQNGHTVDLDGNLEVNDLTIDAGGTFDLTGSGDRLTVAGDWTNSGTFTSQIGRVKMIGITGSNSISGSNAFYDLELNHIGTGVTLNDDTDIWGTLLLSDGTLDVNGNVLTLRSDNTNSASIGVVENGSVSGSVTVERYIASGPTGWRNMGASVSGPTLQQWDDHFTTTGIPGSDFPNWPSPSNRFPSIKSYDETDLGDREIGWRAATNITNSIGLGQGFWMYLGGTELPATVDVTGTLITGDQTLNLDYTPDLGAYHDGWNLVSNVYAATIDWDSPDFGKTGLEDGVWIWNSTVQQYGSYISSVGIHNVSNEIAHSQSFWVHANAASPTLTFREAIKSSNNNADWIRSSEQAEQGIVRIKLTGNGYYDETVLVFNDDASNGYEGTHDAMKFFTPNEEVPSLATLVDVNGEMYDLSINSMPYLTDEISIPLKALAGTTDIYNLSVESISGMEMSTCVAIEDLLTGEIMTLQAGETMAVELNENDSTARFMIHLAAPLAISNTDNTCYGANNGTAQIIGYGAGPWTYTWSTEDGEVIQVSENSFQEDLVSGLSHGTYLVEVSGNASACANRIETFTVFAPLQGEVNLETEQPSCNAENGNIIMHPTGGVGEWTINVFEDGIEVYALTLNEGDEAVASLPKGNYVVIAQNECSNHEFEVVLDDPQAVESMFTPSALEISIADGGSISLTNNSENATHFLWNMGDGTTYTNENVVHVYTEPGTYNVELTSYGLFCQGVSSIEVNVTDLTTSNGASLSAEDINVWFNGSDVIIENNLNTNNLDIQIHDVLGKSIVNTKSSLKRTSIALGDKGFPTGVYFVTVNNGEVIKSKKILIAK